MNIIIAAIALAVAFPATAQAQCHEGSAQQHDPQGPADHKDGCCADKDGDGRMDCCDKGAKRSDGERAKPHVHPKS